MTSRSLSYGKIRSKFLEKDTDEANKGQKRNGKDIQQRLKQFKRF